jgi:8-oxo-dGTP pyrophosphatase MutT (NUDIX family)
MALPRFCSNCAAPLPSPPPVTCPACDTSHWLDAKPCAGALVTRHGKLMLVRRAHEPWRGAWDVPGGFCGPREHPKDAAAREVREETGLAVHIDGILGMWIDTYAPEGPEADKVTSALRATPDRRRRDRTRWWRSLVRGGRLPSELASRAIPAVLRAWRETSSVASRQLRCAPRLPQARAHRLKYIHLASPSSSCLSAAELLVASRRTGRVSVDDSVLISCGILQQVVESSEDPGLANLPVIEMGRRRAKRPLDKVRVLWKRPLAPDDLGGTVGPARWTGRHSSE